MNHLSLFIGAGLAAAGPAFGQTLGAPPHALGTTAPPPVTVAFQNAVSAIDGPRLYLERSGLPKTENVSRDVCPILPRQDKHRHRRVRICQPDIEAELRDVLIAGNRNEIWRSGAVQQSGWVGRHGMTGRAVLDREAAALPCIARNRRGRAGDIAGVPQLGRIWLRCPSAVRRSLKALGWAWPERRRDVLVYRSADIGLRRVVVGAAH